MPWPCRRNWGEVRSSVEGAWTMPYEMLSADEKAQLREYVKSAHDRFATFGDNKETMAFAGLAIFLAAVSTALVSRDWPPPFAQHRPWLIAAAFSVFWVCVA